MVWMRLCLLLASVHNDACNVEVKRLLEKEVWLNTELWDSVRPGLVIYCLKQPAVKEMYKELVPEKVLEGMRKESRKFNELFN